MRKSQSNLVSVVRRSARAGALIAALLALVALIGLSAAPSASAVTYKTVKTFAPLVPQPPNPPKWPEDAQFGGVSGMAINLTGAGGVDPGTVYTVGAQATTPWHAARYSADGDLELAWTRQKRCGPELEPPTECESFPLGLGNGLDIAVDQATGNVYVFCLFEPPFTVRVYRADGTGPIAEFAELDPSGTVSNSPSKLHGSPLNENIAVDNDGTVYVVDEATTTDQSHRLMTFRPQTPGDYEHYVYGGQANDIAPGLQSSNAPYRPVVDNEGNVYVSGEEYIEKYDPDQPTTPICSFTVASGGIRSVTVNPETGAPFYYAFKPKAEIHQLQPCNAQGKFVEIATNPPFSPAPRRGWIEAMAFNPDAVFPGPNFKPGILYAGTPADCPGAGSCPPEALGRGSLGYMFATDEEENVEPSKIFPTVVSESVTRVGVANATLNAKVNPNGPQTSYFFQYISEAAYLANDPASRFAGATQAPLFNTALGNGGEPLLASVTVGGLAPATAYRYRVFALNQTGGFAEGAAARFETFPFEAAGLPNGRAYELVSPAQKNGGEVLPAKPNTASCGSECKPGLAAKRYPIDVLPDGGTIAYQGQPFAFNEGSPEYDEYIASRGPSGWQNIGTSPPLLGNLGGVLSETFDLNSALTRSVMYATNEWLTPGAPPNYRNLFTQPTGNRFDLTPLLTATPPNRIPNGPEGFQMNYVGASPDLSRVFFEANDTLTGPTPWAPVSVDGGPAKSNLYEWSGGQLTLVNVQPGNTETIPGASFGSGRQLANPSVPASDFSNAISADGSRVFWSSAGGQVYVRENGQQTREVPDPSGKFLSAAVDGSKVLLSDGAIYDLQTESLTDVTEGNGGFEGLVGQSDDLSTVYFVANTVITGIPNGQGDVAEAGKHNLYAWRQGAISFIGKVLTEDNEEELGLWRNSPVQRAAEASPNGRWLAFNSKAFLTGSNTIGACQFDNLSQKYVGSIPCEEVYLYDSLSGSLRCVSCSPTGAAPLGGSFLRIMMNASGFLEQPRYLTNDGRLFFDSRDALSSLDTNNGVEDVYQYEPADVGGCKRFGGCISLISPGQGASDANFLAMDPSGNNVFFTTRQQLVPRDQDQLIDLYDARVGGGLAVDFAVPPAECLGEGCQPPPPPAPGEPSPNSSTFQGPGNLKPKKAKKKHHKKKHHKQKKKSQKGKKHKKGSKQQGGKAKHSREGSK